MTEPLPDTEWWPLKFTPETKRNYPVCDFQFVRGGRWYCVVHWTDAERTKEDPLYGVFEGKAEDTAGIKLATCNDLLTLRCFLLKLAYPGGKYG